MQVTVRSNVALSDALATHIENKLGLALNRFRERIGAVTVRFIDVNGPRGGVDKRCRVMVEIPGHKSVVVEAIDADGYVAITRAASRLDEQVSRAIARLREHPRASTHSPRRHAA
ncbi:HPF/RaiA family ribosome-associated protein [Labilithrix luteola]|nr:HPF/RaiA family ribosome-associated protein [Labilithrix luteola]